jgi:hypothetical protein
MAALELSPSLKKRVNTDSVAIACRVTNLDTQTPIPWVVGVLKSDEHQIAVSLRNPNTESQSLLHLPQGRYRIDYDLRPFDTVQRFIERSVYKGTVTVELTTGQTKNILLDDQ